MNPMTGRWLMWVDGVGGFLMLPGDDWTIGGPSGGQESDICIQGDLSSREACLRRLGGDYVLQPFASALLGGRRMHRPTQLRNGDCVTLGVRATSPRIAAESGLDSAGVLATETLTFEALASKVRRPETGGVRLVFSKPHPLSSSARLSLDSRHRIRPRCDAIILLADTCILGPSRSSHVFAAGAESEVVLLFTAGRWWCRGMRETIVDGQPREGRFELAPGARVESGGLAFSLEAL